MIGKNIVAPLMALLFITEAQAQTAAPAAGSPIRVKQVRQQIDVTSDGNSVTTTTAQFQMLSASVTTQLSQFPVNYDASLQSAEVTNAYTLKANGDKIPVDPNNILTQKAATASLVPIYTNAEQKIVIFPRVEAGDTLVFTSKITQTKPILSNQYTLSSYFSQTIEADDSVFSVTAPTSLHLNVASTGMKQDISVQGSETNYRWSFSNLATKANSTALVSEPDAQPHFLVSTFKDYDSFAHDFASRVADKIMVSPSVQKQADIVTSGITDPRQQARALHEWMKQNVRYVAINLGVGGIIPHDADWTLSNGFGDCKDQAVLFASLLKAKNIKAELVLINAANRYRLTGVPTISEFNHMIVWLPDFKIYADTTAAGIALGMLPIVDYGKPVLHVALTGPVQHTTPIISSGLLSSTYKVHAVQNAQGGFDVETTIMATGPWAGSLRRIGADVQRTGSVAAASDILKLHNFATVTGSIDVGTGSDAQYSMSGSFHPGRPAPQGNIFGLTNGLVILPRAGDFLAGPLNNKNLAVTDETPCYSGRQVEDISVDFVNGAHLAATPADLHIKTANASYDTHWSSSGNTVTLHREFNFNIDQPICSGKVRQDIAALLSQIRDDYAAPTHLAAASSAN
jgi:hypothetical protein